MEPDATRGLELRHLRRPALRCVRFSQMSPIRETALGSGLRWAVTFCVAALEFVDSRVLVLLAAVAKRRVGASPKRSARRLV